MNWSYTAVVIGSYLLGSVPVGLVVGRVLQGVDIREYGSGKLGTTNTLRTLGPAAAAMVLVGDLLKGVAPVLAARLVSDDARVQVVAAIAAIAGHDWPVFAGFRGGRGVATSLGATVAMMPPLGLVLPLIGAALLWPFRYVSLMSVFGTLIAALIIVVLALTNRVPDAYAVFAVLAAALIVAHHRENIARLLAGTEPKIGRGGGHRAAGGQDVKAVGSRR